MVFLMSSYSFNRNRSSHNMNVNNRNQYSRMSVLGERQTGTIGNMTRGNLPRRNIQMNTGYNNRQINNVSNTMRHPSLSPTTPVSAPRPRTTSTHLSTYYSNTFIEISANNIVNNGEDFQVSESMYSNFAYNGLDIHFYHNNILDETNVDDIIVGVLSNINYQDIDTIMDEINGSSIEQITNEELLEIEKNNRIKKIEENITSGSYKECKKIVKNDICPITMNSFEDDDIVSIFNGCSHAINQITKDKFISIFVKCPLCNHPLF